MEETSTNRDKALKYHVVCVPQTIKVAKVEILTFRGAPAFIGTMLAKLYFDNKSIILYSKMSGVVNRVLVNNDQIVASGERLFELRNTNTARDKPKNKKGSSNLSAPKTTANFFIEKNNAQNNDDLSNIHFTNESHNLYP